MRSFYTLLFPTRNESARPIDWVIILILLVVVVELAILIIQGAG